MRQESINKKFEIVTNLVSEYYISNEKNHTTNFNKDLCSEILARINKLRYLFERIYSLERQSENFNDVIFQTIKNGNFKENMFREESITIHDPMMMELEILTECFYHIAWRVVDVLKNGRLH